MPRLRGKVIVRLHTFSACALPSPLRCAGAPIASHRKPSASRAENTGELDGPLSPMPDDLSPDKPARTPRRVSTRTRFEVFKRDGFVCVYCGATPVGAPLHIDHIVALVNGGSNAPSNLVTSCEKCNLRKSSVPLDQKMIAAPGRGTVSSQKDHLRQLQEYLAVQKEIDAARAAYYETFANLWRSSIGDINQNMYSRLPGLLLDVGEERLSEAIRLTGRKLGTVGKEWNAAVAVNQSKYLHGILRAWRKAV